MTHQKPIRCAKCKGSEFVSAKETISQEVDGCTFEMEIPIAVCAECNNTYYYDADVLEHFELAIANWFANTGQSSGAVFRFMRRALGIKAAKLANLFSVTPETISRWETGKRQMERRAIALLSAIVSDRYEGSNRVLEMLESFQRPLIPSEKITLESCGT